MTTEQKTMLRRAAIATKSADSGIKAKRQAPETLTLRTAVAEQARPEAERRAGLLRDIIEKRGYKNPSTFARDSDIAYSNLWLYLAGERDLANMGPATVSKLLTSLNVPDTWAWEYFDIPAAARATWRTFRPPPMGHGEDERRLLDVRLDMPLQGDVMVPGGQGHSITVDRDNVVFGLVVTQLADRYLATPASLLPGNGTVLGQLVRVDMSTMPEPERRLSGPRR